MMRIAGFKSSLHERDMGPVRDSCNVIFSTDTTSLHHPTIHAGKRPLPMTSRFLGPRPQWVVGYVQLGPPSSSRSAATPSGCSLITYNYVFQNDRRLSSLGSVLNPRLSLQPQVVFYEAIVRLSGNPSLTEQYAGEKTENQTIQAA